ALPGKIAIAHLAPPIVCVSAPAILCLSRDLPSCLRPRPPPSGPRRRPVTRFALVRRTTACPAWHAHEGSARRGTTTTSILLPFVMVYAGLKANETLEDARLARHSVY